MAVDSTGTSVHNTGPKEWQAKIGKIPVLVGVCEGFVGNRMLRMRDPKGVYAEGGCIDTTREYPKSVSRDHCELVLPRL